MGAKIEHIKVNKFDAQWHHSTLFNDFKFKVVLKPEKSVIKRLERYSKLKKRLSKEAGVEDEDWIVDVDDNCFYLRHSIFLLYWKMKAADDYKNWVETIEEHCLERGECE